MTSAPRPPSTRTLWIWIVAIVGLVALGATLIWAGSGTTRSDPRSGAFGSTGQGAEEPDATDSTAMPSEVSDYLLSLPRRIADDPTAMGDVDAPVVLIEYADLRCAYCALYMQNTLPTIIEEYVETGLVRLEWRDLPLFGEQSEGAAVAARAAGEQGLFWAYLDAVYAAAPERGQADLTEEALLALAEQLDVPDMQQFALDMNSEELRSRVSADRAEAATIGATGTPLFLLNDVGMSGAQTIETFREYIDAQLAVAGQ